MRQNLRPVNKGWRLDYFLVSQDFFGKAVQDSTIHDYVMGSDHCPISLSLDLKEESKTQPK
jgi:exodeoxyribonuclease-3